MEAATRPVSRVYDGVLAAVGDTPSSGCERCYPAPPFQSLRQARGAESRRQHQRPPGAGILAKALRSGRDRPGHGGHRVQLGQHGRSASRRPARYYGLRFICVVDVKTSPQNLRVLRAYGAEIDLVTEPDPETGEFLQARLNRVREILPAIDERLLAQPVRQPHNSGSHYGTTMHEIVDGARRQDRLPLLRHQHLRHGARLRRVRPRARAGHPGDRRRRPRQPDLQ